MTATNTPTRIAKTFLNLTSYSKDDNDWGRDVQTKWSQTVSTDIQTQDEDRPGDINFAFDTVIDANNVYGYDSAYETMSTHSLNNAAKITVNADHYGTAEFTFYGTGFDVISMTSNTTGTITVKVTEDITGDILIYYKNYVSGIYYGGITYRLRIEGGLKAGEIRQGSAAHFNPDNSTVVFVTCS